MKKNISYLLRKFGVELSRPLIREKNIKDQISSRFKMKFDFSSDLLFNSFNYIKRLDNHSISFTIVSENENFLIVKVNEFKFKIESVEDIFIISEVLIDKDYNFLNNEEYIFMDIGFNIGITSLFLSTKRNISKIYGYEPVPHTFEIASENILMNNISKIELKNTGLGGFTRDEVFIFNKNLKGNAGIRGNLSYSINKLEETDKREIKVKIIDVTEELDTIIKSHPNKKIGMKIDCEGGEYELLEKLDKENKFKHIDILMIEWHDKGSEIIENILLKNKYKIFSRVLEINSGMVYATK